MLKTDIRYRYVLYTVNQVLTINYSKPMLLVWKEVDILTYNVGHNSVAAFAYETRCDGECVKIMQASSLDVIMVLRMLYDMLSKWLHDYFADCNHEVCCEDLSFVA
jgi:hypothetical protein